MKSLMLLNARKRRKSRKSSSRRRRTFRRSRRALTGAAAWMSAAGSRRSVRRRRSRARRVTVKVRRLGKGSRRSAVVYVRANPRRRRSYRRNPLGGGNLLGQVKGIFSKENLTTAAGGVAATVLTNYLLNMKKADGSSTLPVPADGDTAKMVRLAYAVGIPALGAILAKKASPSLAKGMLIGGLINGITEGIRSYAPDDLKKTLGFSEYLDYTPTSAVGQLPPSYMAASRFASTRPVNAALDNSSAFPADAWGN